MINENDDPAAGALRLYLYATPTRPGWCRVVTRQVREGGSRVVNKLWQSSTVELYI